MIRKFSIYYIIFLFAFCWGLLVGYKKIFPYSIIKIVGKEVIQLFQDEKNMSDISVVDKIKNDLDIYPSKHLVPYNSTNLINYKNLDINNFDLRRKFSPLFKNNFNEKDNTNIQDGYLLFQGFFDFINAHHGALLINFNGEVLKSWEHDKLDFKDKKKSINLQTHPVLILNDGSIIYTIHDDAYGLKILRVSYCGDLIWYKEEQFHHSFSLDKNNNIWTIKGKDEALVLIDKDNGEILKEILVSDIVSKNRNLGIFNLHLDLPGNDSLHLDPYHINDVEPLNKEIDGFAVDDLLISFRNSNLIFIMDQNLNIKWWKVGATIRQHDPDWGENGITIFDNSMRNNSMDSEKKYMSRVININLENNKIDELYNGSKHAAYTVIKGNHQILEENYLLATFSTQGRILILNNDGELKFELVNKYSKSFNGQIGETIWLSKNFFDFEVEKKVCE